MLWHEISDPSDEWTVNGIPMVWVAYGFVAAGLFLAGSGAFKAMRF